MYISPVVGVIPCALSKLPLDVCRFPLTNQHSSLDLSIHVFIPVMFSWLLLGINRFVHVQRIGFHQDVLSHVHILLGIARHDFESQNDKLVLVAKGIPVPMNQGFDPIRFHERKDEGMTDGMTAVGKGSRSKGQGLQGRKGPTRRTRTRRRRVVVIVQVRDELLDLRKIGRLHQDTPGRPHVVLVGRDVRMDVVQLKGTVHGRGDLHVTFVRGKGFGGGQGHFVKALVDFGSV